jgi:hypothetical protein
VINFTDRIFPQNLNFCPVSLKFHRLKHIIPTVTINILLWQFKEATRLRIYNYVKTECGKTKTRDNFDTRQHMSVRSLEYVDETGITAVVHTKYRHLKKFKKSYKRKWARR